MKQNVKWILIGCSLPVVLCIGLLILFSIANSIHPAKPAEDMWSQTEYTPGKASASPGSRVTKAKFEKLYRGMTLEQCNQIMGFSGVETDMSVLFKKEGPPIYYEWKNPNGSLCNVEFRDNKLITKFSVDL